MEIVDDAHKHGVTDDDIRHAIEHAIRVHAMDGYLLLVGPRRDGQLLEIGYNPTADRVFHAMPVRPKYL